MLSQNWNGLDARGVRRDIADIHAAFGHNFTLLQSMRISRKVKVNSDLNSFLVK